MTGPESIGERLQLIRADIADIARRAGRDPLDVNLVAVSKTQPLAAVLAAAEAGQVHFGENTTQDALTKIPFATGHKLVWHFIGHLQSNKAKFLPHNFRWLHSVDSAALAQRVSRLAQEKGVVIDSLIEVNVARDPRKHGVAPEQLFPLIETLLQRDIPGIRLRGLMAIGPDPATEQEIRKAFAELRSLRDAVRDSFSLGTFDQLSMGMTNDYAAAIKEGSTFVRIGTAIFGAREYT